MELHSELPDGFSDLAPFLDRWRLTGQQSRMRAMAAADMPELRTFYDALLPGPWPTCCATAKDSGQRDDAST